MTNMQLTSFEEMKKNNLDTSNKQTKFNIFELAYILLFVLAMFSGSTALSGYVMPMICAIVIILFLTSIIKGFPKNAIKYKGDYLLKSIMALIVLFLIYQLSFSYNKSVTAVFVERFFVYSLLFVFVPKMDLTFKVIKVIRWYSFFVAISIIITTLITGSHSGGLVGNYQFAGMMMSISFGVFLTDYYFEKNNMNLFGLALTFIALLTSGKRTFSLLALLAYLLIFLISKNKDKRKKFIYMTGSLIMIVFIAYFTIPSVRLVAERLIAYSGDTTYNGRSYFWTAAIDIYEENKAVGIGMGCFSHYFDAFYHRLGNMEAYDAHNIYIQMLAELGIVGELLFVSLFTTGLIKTFLLLKKESIRKNKKCMYILCYSLYIQLWFIIYGFTGNPLYGAGQCFFYISAVAMMLSLKNYTRENKDVNNNEIMR